MNDFRPIPIHHLSLEQLESWQRPPGNHFLVLWHKQRPLGHVWLGGDAGMDKSGFRQSITESLAGTLEKLVSPDNELLKQDIRTLLTDGEYIGLSHLLEKSWPTALLEELSPPPGLSVIVCTRNRPDSLQKCLHALTKSEDRNFELIVVDNSEGDPEVTSLLAEFPEFRYVNEKRKGLGIARNSGIRAATGQIIAFTDDDVTVGKNWTQKLKMSFQDPLTMAVTGLVLPTELETLPQYLFEKYWGFNRGYIPKTFDHRFFLDHAYKGVPVWEIGAGANMAFRREAFDLMGVFDERLEAGAAGCSGDTEYWYRILAEGWNCRYDPDLVVYHEHRKTPEALRNQLYQYARGHACALLVQYEKYGHRGNLVRLRKILPADSFRKITQAIRSGQFRNLGPAWREIRGTVAGWYYFQLRRGRPGYQKPFSASPLLDGRLETPDQIHVSVIIPCYNQGVYLSEAIDSALRQTHPGVEVIVVDDGSTEDLRLVCSMYPAVRYVRVERVGLPAARNIGVAISTGRFLVFLDADDFLYPEAISIQLRYFMEKPGLAFVSGAHDRIDATGASLPVAGPYEKPDDNYCSLLLGNYIGMAATVMYRKELFFHFHFDPRLEASEDYCLNLEIARNYPVLGHTEKIAVYRIHEKSMSSDARFMLRMTLRVLDRQKDKLLDKREKEAYKTGRRNWIRYYRRLLFKRPK
jgi:glycosyltransferase involved in cell wall biosynthesis